MCGIAGIARFRSANESRILQAMVSSLTHRGPDEDGFASFHECGVELGMRRLSIIDIGGGHQPMRGESGRYTLVFNGEIYNYADLWPELVARGHRFVSDHSDTEVIVHGFEEWGTELFKRLNGMFAIAIWDDVERRLILARDRAGEKPLYVGELADGGWVFGSELKALLLHPDLTREVDITALRQFLAFDFILGPRTILRSVRKLPAAHWAVIDRTGYRAEAFWTPSFDRVERTPEALIEELDHLLGKSVRLRMIADVPVGLFLSGGLDSSTIGYYMTHASASVRSFSIGFDDPAFDESAEARSVADHLGIDNTLRVFSETDVRDLVPRITELLDEPMGDQSIFPTYLLSTLAREHVTVALGGDGSDELFMGYRTYQALKATWSVEESWAGPLARRAAPFLPVLGPSTMRKAARLGRSLALRPEDRLLMRLGKFHGESSWVLAEPLRTAAVESDLESAQQVLHPVLGDERRPAERTVGTYLRGYLQEDILVKVDRASMATSLEVRSPFLDPAIIDFALTIPPEQRLPGMTRKDPIRRVMRGRLPDEIIDRPKRGFGVPLSDWLRGALKPLVDDYLADDRMRAAGYFDAEAVRDIRDRHARGSTEAGDQLWLLLQFELWRDRWLGAPTAAGQ